MSYFTKTAHFVGVSSMSFRMKRIYGTCVDKGKRSNEVPTKPKSIPIYYDHSIFVKKVEPKLF